MPEMLWDNAPHRCSLYSQSSGTDTGGGNTAVFSLAQANVACLVNTASSSTVEMYAQDAITVSHTISIKASLLTTTPARGVKVVVDGASYHVEGIRNGRAFMQIPAFCYLDCRELL